MSIPITQILKRIRIPHSHALTASAAPEAEHLRHVQPAAPLILVGDAFQNFVLAELSVSTCDSFRSAPHLLVSTNHR